jgi:wall associated protein
MSNSGKSLGERAARIEKGSWSKDGGKGVKLAWEEERKLIEQGKPGTRFWTDDEKAELRATGKVKGYVGHHINSVSTHPELADVPDNIRFVDSIEHLDAHGGNYHNPTQGELVSRTL